MRFVSLSLLIVAIATTFGLTVYGQATNESLVTANRLPNVGHEYIQSLNDVVDPADGSLSVRIAAPTPTERAFDLPFYPFLYSSGVQLSVVSNYGGPDNNGVLELSSVGIANLYTPQSNFSQTLFTAGSPRVAAVFGDYAPGRATYSVTTLNQSAGISGGTISCTFYSDFVYVDSSGGRHSFSSLAYVAPINTTNQACNQFSGVPANSTSSNDESYSAVLTNINGFSLAVFDDHGNQVFADTANHAINTGPIKDSNGNGPRGSGRSYSASVNPSGSSNPTTISSLIVPGLAGSYSYAYPAAPSHPQSFPLNATLTAQQGTCPGSFASGSAANTGNLVVGLPNKQSYTFSFDPNGSEPAYGLITKIVYPTSAWVKYYWGPNLQSQEVAFGKLPAQGEAVCSYHYDWPAVQKRIVSFDGTTPAQEQDFTYSPTTWSTSSNDWTSKQTTVTTKDLLSAGTPSFDTVYSYVPLWYGNNTVPLPVENQIVYKDTNGSVLQTVNKVWNTPNQLASECTTLPGGQVSGVFYSYAKRNGNGSTTLLPADKAEYDFGTVTSGCTRPSTTATRETITVYQSFANNSTNPNASYINDRPQSVKVYDKGTLIAETDYTYDGATIVPVSAVNHDDSNYGANYVTGRGNVTKITRKCLQSCPDAITLYQYDATGQLAMTQDPDGNQTSYSYLDSYTNDNGSPSGNTNIYMTSITPPQTTTNGAAVSHKESFQYGYNDGKLRRSTDANSKTTQLCYWIGGCSGTTFDPWLRIRQTITSDGGGSTVSYSDAGPTPNTTTTTLASPDPSIVSTTTYDAFGHPTVSKTTSAGSIEIDTTYNGFGQVVLSTNPYSSTTDPTYGVTQFTYDSLGRKTTQIQPNTPVMQWCYNGVASSGQTNCGTSSAVANSTSIHISNENGALSENDFDAFGRLVAVREANLDGSTRLVCGTHGCTTLMVFGNTTTYGYNALNNMTSAVQQGSSTDTPRSRSFNYDSLSRLLTATNPENGTICYGQLSGATCSYGYDPNGNLQYQTDARGVTTQYSYDALNRLVSKSYPSGTPSSCYQYDQSSLAATGGNLIGRLTNSWTQSGTCPASTASPNFQSSSVLSRRSILSYDAMGRVTSEQQCVLTNCAVGTPYNITYTYDLAGQVTKQSNGVSSNPMIFTKIYDGLGRLCSLGSGAVTLFATPQYVPGSGCTSANPSSPGYSPAGGLMNATFGTGLQLSRSYDNRLRVSSETDTGNGVSTPTPGTAIIAIKGIDQTQ